MGGLIAKACPQLSSSGKAARSGAGKVPGQRIRVAASTLAGTRYEVEVLDSDTVGQLKDSLVAQVDIQKRQLALVLGGQVLRNDLVLSAQGIGDGAELSLVIGQAEPEWALEFGLGPEHPDHLRSFFERHSHESPEYLGSNEAVWEKLRVEKEKLDNNKKTLSGWSHFLRLEKDGEPCGTITASPGESISITVRGWIYNNQGDTCIHQLVLALDNEIVAEIHDGVPCRGVELSKRVSFKAPAELGSHLLWRRGDLQYSMRDARRNFQQAHGNKAPQPVYPGGFVGWLVVQ